ncbi:MFS transporter [Ruegeria sp. HKCCD8929]|uniref:MFS transporter n=1 Tax=Ruegeria sp. HKCCD8929 TaxID=2683006 RepID=UPI0014896069|nr:MFS transporter [Ruegeria sp. HKCCD8929]
MTRNTLALIVVFSLIPLGPLAIDIFLPSMPEMQNAFGATEAEMRLTIPFYVYALGVAQLFGGPVSDRWGRLASAMLGLGAYVAASLVAAVAPDLIWLYAARILQGLGASFTMVTAFAWVRDNFEGDEAGKWLSYMSGLTGSVPMIAPVIGGVLAGIWGWQASFVMMALAGALILVAAPFALTGERTTKVAELDAERLSCNLRSLMSSRSFLIYSLANTTTFGALMAYVSIAPEVAMTRGGMDEMTFAFTLGGIGLLQMVFSFAAPIVVARIGARRTVLTGLAMSVAGGTGLMFINEMETSVFFAFAALGGGGFSLMIGISTGLTLQPFPNCAGLAASVGGFLRMFGGAAIATFVGLTDLTGPQMLALALLTSLLPMVLMLFNAGFRAAVSNA